MPTPRLCAVAGDRLRRIRAHRAAAVAFSISGSVSRFAEIDQPCGRHLGAVGSRLPKRRSHPSDERFHDSRTPEADCCYGDRAPFRQCPRGPFLCHGCSNGGGPTAPPGCGSGSFLSLLRAEGVARSHDCRRGKAQAGLGRLRRAERSSAVGRC